jgi:predicted secreted protein
MSTIRSIWSSLSRLILAALTALLVSGCSTAKGDPPVVAPAGNRENGILILTQADHNRTAEIKIGEQITVRLPENPSTGFSWAIDESDRQRLALDSTAFAEATEVYVGARGQRIFTFTARQAGAVALKLKYWRFWEGDASVTERYAVTLQIRD